MSPRRGHEPRVWAPAAGRVELHRVRGGDTTVVEMAPDPDGWWHGGSIREGDDYGFLVDGAGPFPDPRSPAQPHGVHGLSRWHDARGFAWSDADWRGLEPLGAVHYELHVGTFTPGGTLDAAAAELPRLAAAGIELVVLMPVAPFPGDRGWGYDGVGMFAVHEAYGGPGALQRFVDAAHRAGLGVALDVVFNHQGPDGNYLRRYGPYFTDRHHTPWGHGANLDGEGSEQVRRHFLDAARRWFDDFHLDALRLDAVHALADDSPRHFLAELSDATAELAATLGRPLALIAESDLNDARMVAPTAAGGLGQTMQWADDVHHALHAYLAQERTGYYVDFGSVETLDHVFREVFLHDGRHATLRGGPWGAPVPPEVDRRRFVVFASNHDQVGNRPLGDRPAASLSPGAHAASLAFVLLGPFTPMLFMGEEHGEDAPFQYFTDHDGALGAAVSAGRRAEFELHGGDLAGRTDAEIPDPQDPATFARSTLAHAGSRAPRYARIRDWVATCVGLRGRTRDPAAWAAHPARMRELAPRVVELLGPVRVTANLSDSPVQFELEPRASVLGLFGEVRHANGVVTLAPDSVALAGAAP